MPFNASGVFQRLFNWRNDRDAGIRILAERMDQEMDGLAAALNAIVQANVSFKGPLLGVYGTASAPAFSFQEDSDTGIFHGGTDKLALSAGGTKVLELKADQIEALTTLRKGTFSVDGDFLSLESGAHWITYDDGAAGLNLRAGHKTGPGGETHTSNGTGAAHLHLDHKAADPGVTLSIGAPGALDAGVTWGPQLIARHSGALTWNGHTIWHGGNAGPGSGLNADLLDGVHAASFVRGDGVNGGQVAIETGAADFIVSDGTDSQPNYIWRDQSSSKLIFGSTTVSVAMRADTTVDADLAVTGSLQVDSGPFKVQGSQIELSGVTPEIVFNDTDGDLTPTTYVGINPSIGNDTLFGAFGIIHRPTSGSYRGITIHETVDDAPFWRVSSTAYKILTTAIGHGDEGALAFLKNVSGGHLVGGAVAAGSQLRDSSTSNNSGAQRSGTWRALASVPANASGLFMRIA